MNIASLFEYGNAFLGARFAGRRVPLVVSIVVTNRCNYSCAYCDRWDGRGSRLSTEQLRGFLREMAEMGTRRVIFTGGEPLVRKDIYGLIALCKTLGMKVNVNSNGTLVPQQIERLKGLDGLTISIDGDRATHDEVRGEGAFDAAIAAVRAAREHPGIQVRLSCTLSRVSVGGEAELLEIARREQVEVFFQPAEHRLLGGEGDNPIAAPREAYRRSIDTLIAAKKGGAPIANSTSALRYLRGWPDGSALPCAGAKLFCRLDYDGRVMICGRMGEYEEAFSAIELGFREAFLKLNDARCPTCWCASRVEVNQAFALRADAVLGLARASR